MVGKSFSRQRSATHLPTPREIRRLCAEIRSRWTASEHERRSQYDVPPVVTEIVPATTIYGDSDRGE